MISDEALEVWLFEAEHHGNGAIAEEIHRLRTELDDVHAARIKAETTVTRLTLDCRKFEAAFNQARDAFARMDAYVRTHQIEELSLVAQAAEALVRWHENCGLDLRTGGALVLLRTRLSAWRGE